MCTLVWHIDKNKSILGLMMERYYVELFYLYSVGWIGSVMQFGLCWMNHTVPWSLPYKRHAHIKKRNQFKKKTTSNK